MKFTARSVSSLLRKLGYDTSSTAKMQQCANRICYGYVTYSAHVTCRTIFKDKMIEVWNASKAKTSGIADALKNAGYTVDCINGNSIIIVNE